MGNLIIITLMAAGLLGVIKSAGWNRLSAAAAHGPRISGARGAQACVAALVGIVNLCTANNTVAIITTGTISRDIARTYGITPRKTASLLDTASCIVQALIPYGFRPCWPPPLPGSRPPLHGLYMVYPWALAVSVGISVAWVRKNEKNDSRLQLFAFSRDILRKAFRLRKSIQIRSTALERNSSYNIRIIKPITKTIFLISLAV